MSARRRRPPSASSPRTTAIFGDWYLALAAYNCGVGTLSAILRRSPGSDFWALRKKGVLPRETAAFVPQFLALTRILGHAGRYGLDLGWDAPPDWSVIALDRCVDLRMLSRASGRAPGRAAGGQPRAELPGHTAGVLWVPAQGSRRLRGGGDRRAGRVGDPPDASSRSTWWQHGDTLYGMSLRYGVSVPFIQEFNPVGSSPRALRIGAKVLVPVVPPRRAG